MGQGSFPYLPGWGSVGKPGICIRDGTWLPGELERNRAAHDLFKGKTVMALSLYLPEITSDKAGVAWAASIIMMMLPVILFVMGAESLEQGIAASGIKE